MPRHAAGMGGRSFPVGSKMLARYEQERAYKLHLQKLASTTHRLDVAKPKKQTHLILRLKQIQKEEERQAEIDHENKLLLHKMTHTMKYGGNIDNWNNYETRSLNFPLRERNNEDIARENMGIARRLETVRPQLRRDKWEKDYRKHAYIKRMWNERTKDFGEISPRRYSQMSQAHSLDNSFDEMSDLNSDVPSEGRLPKLHKRSNRESRFRATKSDSGAPTKLPRIFPASKRAEEPPKANSKPAQTEQEPDVAQLFKVAKQLAPPDQIIIKHLIKKSYKQRMQMKVKFRQKYDLDLITELKDGLGLDWEHLIDALLQERGVSDSYAIFDALSVQTSKKTSDMSDVVELLCTRDNAAIADLKESYRKEFSISLEEDLADRTNPPVQTLLTTLQKGRVEDTTDLDTKEVWNDAVALHESGEGCWTSETGKFMRILTEKSPAHLKAVLAEYKTASGGANLLDVVKTDCPEDYHAIMVTLVRITQAPEVYFADQLYKHKLPSNPIFVNILVTRSEVDMPVVRRVYKKKYQADLVEDIKIKPYPTTKCLVELACKVPPGMRGKAENTSNAPKKTYTKTVVAFTSQPSSKKADNKPVVANQSKPPQKKVEPTASKSKPPQENAVNGGPQTVKKQAEQTIKSKPPQDNAATGNTQNATKSKPPQDNAATGNTQNATKSKPPQDNAATGNTQNATKSKPSEDPEANPLSQPTKRVHAEAAKQRKEQEEKDRLREDGDHNGTVKPVSNFSPDADIDKLHSAMSGIGTDEDVIIDIIPNRSNRQRQELKRKYEQKFNKNLMIDLESELRGDFEEIILALMMTPAEYDAYCIHEAVEGLGTSEATLIGILCSRNGKDIKAIREHYKKAYKSDMERDIAQDMGGDFEKMVQEMCKGEREQGSEVNKQEAQADAKSMYRDDEDVIDPNNSVFKALMAKKNPAQVMATFEEYKKLSGQDVYTALTKASLGDDEDGYIGVAHAVADPVQFYAERLNSCFSGLGTNDNMLIRIIVSRSEVDLKDIKGRFFELYGKTLADTLQRECTGDYKRILLAILADKPDAKSGGKGKGQKDTPAKKISMTKGPTVFPADPFNPTDDCTRIHDGMPNYGTDEAVLVEILPSRSNKQRQQIKQTYQQMYQQSLMIELESELRSDFEEMVLALLMTPTDYDAHCIHEAMIGLGTSDLVLIGILFSRSSQELKAISQQYNSIYGKDLTSAIQDGGSSEIKELMVELSKGERTQGTDVNLQEATNDAKAIYEEGETSFDPNNTTFKELLLKKSKAQVKATFEEYKKLSDKDIYHSIEAAFLGEIGTTYLAIACAAEDPVKFYAKRLHDSFEGVSSNDMMLIRIAVSRSEIDMADIKSMYEALFKKRLSERIQSECKGGYKEMLLAVIGDK